MSWQLQEAKNKLSELVKAARRAGPQTISVRGKDAVVVLSVEQYRQLTRKRESLVDFLLHSPLHDSGLEIERDADTGREVEL
jgi:prevent-host-death family protein